MATFKFVGPAIEGISGPTASGTWGTAPGQAPPMPFGYRQIATDPTYGAGEFVLVAGSNVSAGNLVQIVGNYSARAAGSGTASIGPVGFAPVALSATNVYGWVMVRGQFDSASNSAAAANGVPIKMGTVAGAIDSRTASNDTHQIYNMYNQGSNTASAPATIMMDNPWYRGF